MQLFIFDVDGTLTWTNELDADCYMRAVERHFDIEALDPDWRDFEHPTATGITRELLGMIDGASAKDEAVETIRSSFLEELERAVDGGEIEPVPGAGETLAMLRDREDTAVAIATGDWRDSSHFKLDRAGLEVDDIAFASSDDAIVRREIIRAAVERTAAGEVEQYDSVTYVGDGVWDLRAARELGIEFVGVGEGERLEGLRRHLSNRKSGLRDPPPRTGRRIHGPRRHLRSGPPVDSPAERRT